MLDVYFLILKSIFVAWVIRFLILRRWKESGVWRHPLMGSGEWLATPLCARGQAGSNVNVGWPSPIEAVQWGNYSRRKSSLSVLLARFCQSIPFKMAYHSPYKAPPHINAPPDQGFLWNIFQRWVERGGLFRCCLPVFHSAPQWKLLFVARRGREWGRVVVVTLTVSFTARVLSLLSRS